MAGVQKINLNNLNINLKNALIVGIIIAKNSPRTIGSRKKNGDLRGVTSFTLRDSEVDTINVDVWGSEYFVLTFYERFLVGDVEDSSNVYVDLLVVVKSVKPRRIIKTKAGTEMTIGSVEIIDNTTPASVFLDIFDIDSIQRAEQWEPLESVLFISDARVSWRGRGGVALQACARSVLTHQPYTADAEALRLYIRNQANTRGGWAAAWSAARACCVPAARVRDLTTAHAHSHSPACVSLHALLTHLHFDEHNTYESNEELRIRFADHTGEVSAWIPINVLEEALEIHPDQLKQMNSDEKATVRWKILLEQCNVKLVASSSRLTVLSLRRASAVDPIPLC